MEGGFLKQEGLEAEWSVAAPGKSAVEAIANGKADVIQTALIQNINDLENNRAPVSTNFAQVNEMDGFFISAREADADFNWEKLEGSEVIMFAGGQPNYMFRYACHKAGIDFNKIIPITPGGPADIDAAFRAGQGQYVQQQGPYPQQLENDGIAYIVARNGKLIGPCAFSSLAADPKWLTTNEAKAFCRAYRKTRQYLNEESAIEIARMEKHCFPETDLEALTACIKSYQSLGCWSPHIEITDSAYQATLDIFEHAGVLNHRYQYEQVCSRPPI
jgi:NitT/TauT family transport system substrate-binding protein